MYDFQPPIFVFSDDLNVFASPADAERSFDPWIDQERYIYDARGTVFAFGAARFRSVTPADPPRQDRDELVARLRKCLVNLAAERPDRADAGWARSAAADELIGWFAEHMLERVNPPGRTAGEAIAAFLQRLMRLSVAFLGCATHAAT